MTDDPQITRVIRTVPRRRGRGAVHRSAISKPPWSRGRGVSVRTRSSGYEIVHPLTEEAWGTRRFFVRDPNGVVVNVVGHPD